MCKWLFSCSSNNFFSLFLLCSFSTEMVLYFIGSGYFVKSTPLTPLHELLLNCIHFLNWSEDVHVFFSVLFRLFSHYVPPTPTHYQSVGGVGTYCFWMDLVDVAVSA